MGVITDQNIVYQSLEDISIFRYDKVLRGDLRYLVVDFKFGQIELPENIEEISEKLYNDWSKLFDNLESAQIYALACEIEYIKNQLIFVPELVNRIIQGVSDEVKYEFLESLNKWQFKYNEEQTLEQNVDYFKRILRGLESKLKMKIGDYEDLNKSDSKPLTIQQQKIKAQRLLKFNINLKETSVIEWKAILDECNNIKTVKSE